MNVSGLATNSASSPNVLAIIAPGTCDGAIASVRLCRRAISSTTMKPTLWRVSRYSRPGFPSPTIRRIYKLTNLQIDELTGQIVNSNPTIRKFTHPTISLFLRGFLFLLGLPLLNDFRFGGRRCSRGCRCAFRGRRRGRFLGLRHHDVHQHRFAIGDGLPFRVRRDVLHANRLVEHELADVDVDVFGDIRRQALHLDLARDEIEKATLLLDAGG